MARTVAILLLLTFAVTLSAAAADSDCGSGCSLACLTCACCHVQGVIEGQLEIPLALFSNPVLPLPPAVLPAAESRGVLHVPKPL